MPLVAWLAVETSTLARARVLRVLVVQMVCTTNSARAWAGSGGDAGAGASTLRPQFHARTAANQGPQTGAGRPLRHAARARSRPSRRRSIGQRRSSHYSTSRAPAPPCCSAHARLQAEEQTGHTHKPGATAYRSPCTALKRTALMKLQLPPYGGSLFVEGKEKIQKKRRGTQDLVGVG